MLDLQHEQHEYGQQYSELYESVVAVKKRYGLHEVKAQSRDSLAVRRDNEREQVQELVKRFRDIPGDHQRQLPALLNSLAQLELLIGEFDAAQQDFDEVASLVQSHDERAEAHHNTYHAALERRDWPEALAALLRACTLAPDLYEPFPLARFEPVSVLGAGALGVTFLCVEKGSGERVVVKALREDTLERPAGLILHEMQWLSEIEQPALMRLREHGFADGNQSRPYLVLEHFEGVTLAEYVRRNGPLAPADALAVLWPIARALQALHGRGVLHRGLSPWSVLVRRLDPESFTDLEEDEEAFELPDDWDADEHAPDEFAESLREEGEAEFEDEEEDGESPAWSVRMIETALSVKRVVLHAAASNPAARAHTGLGRSVARSLVYAPSEVVSRPKGMVWVGPHSDIYSFGRLCCFALTGRAELSARHGTPSTENEDEADEEDALRAAFCAVAQDCTAWVIAARPQHVGAVLDRLSELPGAGAIIDAVEEQGAHELLAEFGAVLRRNPDDLRARISRANLLAGQGDHEQALVDYAEALKRRPHDANLLRKRGESLLESGDTDGALADFSRAIELEPRNLDGWSLRARAQSRKGDHDAAVADWTEVIRQDPKNEDAWFSRGNEHYSRGDWESAVSDYSAVLRLDPKHLWSFGNRGKCRAHLGEHDRAVADFAQLLRLDPGNARACKDRGQSLLALGRYDEAIADFTRGLEHDPSPAMYNERGLARAEHGEHDLAIDDFTRAHDLDPESPHAVMYRGNSWCDKGELDDALIDLSEAVRLGPELAVAWYNRGNVYARMGNLEQALADYDKAVELDGSHAGAWFNRGNAHADRGEFDHAVADYTRALQLDPTDGAALNNRGNAHAARGDLDAALADFDAALRLSPQDVVALFNRGNTHSRLGELDEAVADYTEVVRLSPDHSRAWNNRGNAHQDQGKVAEALADYARAIEADPRYARAYNTRGELLATEGRLDEALAELTKAIEIDPALAAAWYNRGKIRNARRELDEALADLSKALELDPADPAILVERASVYQRKRTFEPALADLTKAVELDPASGVSWLSRGHIHGDLGNEDAALADYTRAIEVAPRLISSYHNRGRILAGRGDYQGALDDNLAALALDPEHPLTLNNLAWLWATHPRPEARDPAKSVEHARQACAAVGWENPGYLDTLAVACAASGQFEEAVRWQEKALQLAPESEKPDYQSRLDLYRAGRPYVAG